MKIKQITKNELAIKKLQNYLGLTDEQIDNDYNNDYITINTFKNKGYVWYTNCNAKNDILIVIDTLEIITDEKKNTKNNEYIK